MGNMPSGRPGFIVWLKAWFLGLIILHGLTRSKSEFIRHQENVLTKKGLGGRRTGTTQKYAYDPGNRLFVTWLPDPSCQHYGIQPLALAIKPFVTVGHVVNFLKKQKKKISS